MITGTMKCLLPLFYGMMIKHGELCLLILFENMQDPILENIYLIE